MTTAQVNYADLWRRHSVDQPITPHPATNLFTGPATDFSALEKWEKDNPLAMAAPPVPGEPPINRLTGQAIPDWVLAMQAERDRLKNPPKASPPLGFAGNYSRALRQNIAPLQALLEPVLGTEARLAGEAAIAEGPATGTGAFLGHATGSVARFVPAIVGGPAGLLAVAAESGAESADTSLRNRESFTTAAQRGALSAASAYVGGKLAVGEGSSLIKSIAVNYGGGAAITAVDAVGQKLISYETGAITKDQAIGQLQDELPQQILEGGATQLLIHGLAVTGRKILTPRSESTRIEANRPVTDSVDTIVRPGEMQPADHAEALKTVTDMLAEAADPDSGVRLSDNEMATAIRIKDALETIPPAPKIEEISTPTPTDGQPATVVTGPDAAASGKELGGSGGTVKDQIRQAIMGPRALISMTERSLLKLKLSSEQRAAKLADKVARTDERAIAKDKISQVRQTILNKQADVNFIKGQIISLARESIKGTEVPKAILTAVGHAKTHGDLARAMRQISQHMDDVAHTEAIDALKATVSKADPAKMLPQFKKAFKAAMEQIDLNGMTDAKRARLSQLQDAVDSHPDQFPNRVIDTLDRLGKKPVDELSTQEIIDLTQSLSDFMANDKLLRQADSLEQQARDLAIQNGVIAELNAAEQVRQRPVDRAGHIAEPAKGKLAGIKQFLRLGYGKEETNTVDTQLDEISGSDQSLTHQIGYQSVMNARRNWYGGFYETMGALQSHLNSLGLSPGSPDLGKLSMNLDEKHADVHTITLDSGAEIKIDAAHRINLLCLLKDSQTGDRIAFDGNDIHLSRTPEGERVALSHDDVVRIIDSASPDEKRIANFMFNWVNTEGKAIAERAKVAVRDDAHFPSPRVHEGKQPEASLFTFDGQGLIENTGIGRQRTGGKEPILVQDAFVAFQNYVWKILAMEHMAPAVRQVRKLLLEGPVKSELRNSNRFRTHKMLTEAMDALARMAVGGPRKSTLVDDAMGPLLDKAGAAMLAGNVKVLAYQPISVVSLISELPAVHVTSATMRGAMFDGSIDARMNANPIIRHRADMGIGLANEGSESHMPLLGFHGQGFATRMMTSMDSQVSRVAWRAAELWGESQGLTGKALQEFASENAERAIARTQPMSDPLNVSGAALSAKTNKLAKIVVFFRAQTSKMVSQINREIFQMRRGEGNPAKHAAMILWILGSNSVLTTAIQEAWDVVLRRGNPDPKVKDRGKEIAGRLIENVASIPVFGALFGYPLKKLLTPTQPAFDPSLSPVLNFVETSATHLGTMAGSLHGKDKQDRAISAAFDATADAMVLLNIPFSSMVHDAKKVWQSEIGSSPQSSPRPGV